MPTFEVHRFPDPSFCPTGHVNSSGWRLTFAERGALIGTLTAPEGSKLQAIHGTNYLRVPGCGDPRLTAREAVALAKGKRYGMTWEEAVGVEAGSQGV